MLLNVICSGASIWHSRVSEYPHYCWPSWPKNISYHLARFNFTSLTSWVFLLSLFVVAIRRMEGLFLIKQKIFLSISHLSLRESLISIWRFLPSFFRAKFRRRRRRRRSRRRRRRMEEWHIPPRGMIEMEEHGGGGAGWRRMEGQFLIKQRFVFVHFAPFPPRISHLNFWELFLFIFLELTLGARHFS